MDSQTRAKYESILQEDWVKLGYQCDDDEPGLNSELHPLFQRTNASRPTAAEHIWPQYKSEAKYKKLCDELGAVLQIASNMLETPSSLDFLYQVVYSRRVTAGQGLNSRGIPCKEFGWDIIPPVTGRQMARNPLRHLSHSLRFLISSPNTNPAVEGSVALTATDPEGFPDGVNINETSSKMGVASTITLNKHFIFMLKNLIAQEKKTVSQKLSLQVKLAITLCHEITHALAFAVDSELLQWDKEDNEAAVKTHSEPFYQDETMAEIGRSWENQVFGGKIMWWGNTNEPLFVGQWPSFLIGEINIPPKRGTEKSTAQKYIVSKHYIRNMYRQGFWDNVKPEHTNALHVKKAIGIEYDNPDAEAQSIDSSRIEWPHDENSSRVSRERNGQPVPDPSDSGANETEKERMRVV